LNACGFCSYKFHNDVESANLLCHDLKSTPSAIFPKNQDFSKKGEFLMPSRGLLAVRGFYAVLLAVLVVSPFGFLSGCGGSESTTHVVVDKEKESAALKSMADFYAKKQGKAKGRPIR
jgi:hypothetical protein